jgi:hypothetical protein
MQRCGVRIGALLLVLTVVACASSRPANDFELAVGDSAVEIALSRDVVLAMLGNSLGTSLECDGEGDEDVRVLLAALAHDRRGTMTMRHGEDRVVARRRGSRLTLTVTGDDGGQLEATVPWAVGECLLGRRTTVEEALGSRPISVRLTTAEGTIVTARLR